MNIIYSLRGQAPQKGISETAHSMTPLPLKKAAASALSMVNQCTVHHKSYLLIFNFKNIFFSLGTRPITG